MRALASLGSLQRPLRLRPSPSFCIFIGQRTYASNIPLLRQHFEDILEQQRQSLPFFYSIDSEFVKTNYPMVHNHIEDEFNGRLDEALQQAFPEHKWQPWRFASCVSYGFWKSEANRKAFFDWYARDVLDKDPEDPETWYPVLAEDIEAQGGGTMLSKFYRESVREAVTQLYHPAQGWMIWRFPRVPAGWWDTLENQRSYVEWFGQNKLNIRCLEDWYTVKASQWQRDRLAGLVNSRYGTSLSRMLFTLYPNHQWREWLFSTTPRRWWHDPAHQRKYLDWAFSELGLAKMDDWYAITAAALLEKAPGASHFLGEVSNHSLSKALKNAYPEHEWVEARHIQSTKQQS